ncbi:hypothetical protein D1646_14065 [Pseudoflavonifractor sp. 60]|uniref:recombinase family protein n=1 Tax=Pseudoflavonifractor sp. 60 TaxID=2304576 RepID=UPI00136B3DDD|nr:recombinase family protein [Pseudoflavonifractor sp. 60]NBI67906.1 hypothetical protein [Pseudoflavonifractor sp. 60]
MKIRKLPFGYCIRNGVICVDKRSADTVRMIFDGYIQMASYEKVADMLVHQGLPYIPEKWWNKNIVARILKERRYMGDEEYPAIITQNTFHCAEAANTWSCDSPERMKITKELRSLVRCPSCGGTMTRNYRANWRCPNCMNTSVKVTDENLMKSLTKLLAQSKKLAPDFEIPAIVPDNGPVQDLERALEQELNQNELDEVAAKQKVIDLAATQFNALSSADYETLRLKYMLSNKEQDGDLDTGLLFDITSAILIYPSGAISLKLKNGQIIGRS